MTSTSPRYSVSAMTMPAISAPSTAEKPIAEVTRLATITTSRQAARNTSGFLVRAACANRIGSSSLPPNSRPSATAPPSSRVPSSGPTPAVARRRHRAQARRRSGPAQRLRTAACRARRGPTADCVPTSGRTIAVEDSASARPSPIEPGIPCPIRCRPPPMIAAQPRSSAAPTPNTIRRIDHSRRKRQLEADRKQQEDNAELGERLDRVRVRDRQIVQPRMLGRERAQACRARPASRSG